MSASRCAECGAGTRAMSEREPSLCMWCDGIKPEPVVGTASTPGRRFFPLPGAYRDERGIAFAESQPGQVPNRKGVVMP